MCRSATDGYNADAALGTDSYQTSSQFRRLLGACYRQRCRTTTTSGRWSGRALQRKVAQRKEAGNRDNLSARRKRKQGKRLKRIINVVVLLLCINIVLIAQSLCQCIYQYKWISFVVYMLHLSPSQQAVKLFLHPLQFFVVVLLSLVVFDVLVSEDQHCTIIEQ